MFHEQVVTNDQLDACFVQNMTSWRLSTEEDMLLSHTHVEMYVNDNNGARENKCPFGRLGGMDQEIEFQPHSVFSNLPSCRLPVPGG